MARKKTDKAEQAVQETEEEQTVRETEEEQAVQEAEEDTAQTVRDAPQDAPERDIFDNLPSPCVYCGPTVRGVARQYTTYQGGITNELRDFIKAHPEARGLIVSTEKFAGVRKRLDTPGTAEAVLFKKVKSQL